jgi:hypothetical protein
VKIRDIGKSQIEKKLKNHGLTIAVGPFSFLIQSDSVLVADGLHLLYADYPVYEGDFIDFHINLSSPFFRKYVHPQIDFFYEGFRPFRSLPKSHAFPLLEWGMNWCISTQVQHYLLLHSAVLEKNGCVVVMPAPPGSGKSTLCAALTYNGWRLLSDELGIIDLKTLDVIPLGKPISLKNNSIDLIKSYCSDAVMSPPVADTSKGTVAHLKVPRSAVERLKDTARPGAIVFPRYTPAHPSILTTKTKPSTVFYLAQNSFNYMLLGKSGFDALTSFVDKSACYSYEYSNLSDAVAAFNHLAESFIE